MTGNSENQLPFTARLSTRIGALVVLVALSTSILIGLSSLFWIKESLRSHVESEFERVLDRVSRDVDQWYAVAISEVEESASGSGLARILREVDAEYDVGNTARNRLQHWTEKTFKKMRGPAALLLVDEFGDIVGTVGKEMLHLNTPAYAKLFSRKIHISGAIVIDDNVYQLVSIPVPSAQGEENSRFTLVGLYETLDLDRLLESEQFQSASRLYLLDSGVNIVSPATNRRSVKDINRALPMSSSEYGRLDFYEDQRGRPMVGSMQAIALTGGAVAIERSYSSVFDPVSKTILGILVSSVITILLLGISAVLISRSIMRRLNALSNAVIRMRNGDLKTEIDVSDANDEVSVLTKNFNAMREELYQARRVLKKEARVDGLTGLYNRRCLEEQMPVFEKWSRRMKSSMSLLVIDLDHFKIWNDTFGHDVGDKVLRIAGSTLKQLTRDTDFVARLGGDEFIVLVVGTDLLGATTLAEKIRQEIPAAIDRERSRLGVSVNDQAASQVRDISLSIGVSSYNGSREALFKNADDALYEAKAAGRDKVRVHRQPLEAVAVSG